MNAEIPSNLGNKNELQNQKNLPSNSRAKLQIPIMIKKENPYENEKRKTDSLENMNPLSHKGITVCNISHKDSLVYFNFNTKNAYCRNCFNKEISVNKKNDAITINEFISNYNAKINELKKKGSRIIEAYAFNENVISDENKNMNDMNQKFQEYIFNIQNIKNMILAIIRNETQ